MQYKCKICAGTLTIDPRTRIATCDYCGTAQTLPLFDDDSSGVLYERGNQYLLHNEYDRAESIFNQLLSVNPNDAEIYWDLVLCKYGVTYAKDPQTDKYIPTCNRTHTDSIFSDSNYLKAKELSSDEKTALYKKDAEIIDNIQKGILTLSRQEKPFDIFISYKETDENGNRTKDSIAAQNLYEKFTELGYKVFFSRITLESRIGEEYEPYIYAALSSSKVMLTVCSSRKNIESAWVKNEWSRYLLLRREDTSKVLIPLYFDMSQDDLPEEFGLLSAQDIDEEGFEQDLIRGIKKLIPTPVELKAKREKRNKLLRTCTIVIIAISIPLASIICYRHIKEKRMAAQYIEAENLFKSKEYEKARALFEELGDYEDSEQMVIKTTYYGDYDAAMELFYAGNYPESVWALKQIGDYDDVSNSLERAINSWREELSTVATEVDLGANSAYYITTNGTVDSFKENPGNENIIVRDMENGVVDGTDTVSLGEHGKVVSIAENYALYFLCEDGYVYNSGKLNQMDEDWSDAVQITDRFNVTSAALMEDGTIKLGQTEAGSEYYEDDEWLLEAAEWTNITQIDWAVSQAEGVVDKGIFAGLNSDGKVKILFKSIDESYDTEIELEERAKEFVENLGDIKKIRVNTSIDYMGMDIPYHRIYIVAMDQENKLHIFSSDREYTKDAEGVKDFWVSPEGTVYIIDSKNRLLELNSDKVILEGAVYVDEGYCVSQSGTIYTVDGEATSGKTKVKDVWLSR